MSDPRPNRDHLGMMAQPKYWPKWPMLPIKNNRGRKPGEFPRLAVLIEMGMSDTPDIRFVEGDMFMIDHAAIKSAPKADPKALVAEGWEVD